VEESNEVRLFCGLGKISMATCSMFRTSLYDCHVLRLFMFSHINASICGCS
jgi:hypothetical protein